MDTCVPFLAVDGQLLFSTTYNTYCPSFTILLHNTYSLIELVIFDCARKFKTVCITMGFTYWTPTHE